MKTTVHSSPTKKAAASPPVRKKRMHPIVKKLLEEQAAIEGPSLWDRIKDVIVDDPLLPPDLSTNPKRMENYKLHSAQPVAAGRGILGEQNSGSNSK